ncbi:MAG TPA: thiol peroxidase [Anaerolineales bacterium]|nr:thiol peroxidase [Anaerolineales bacterium]
MIKRQGIFKFQGMDVTVVGEDLQVGDLAPEFTPQAKDWSSVAALESTAGKVRIIGSMPSFSTSVCDRETRRFNEEAASLGDEVAILMVSMDLPWTLRNWCAAAAVERLQLLSDHKEAEFGEKYGVLLLEPRIFRRAIFVVDRAGKIANADYLPVLGEEPDYAKVLEVARQAIG